MSWGASKSDTVHLDVDGEPVTASLKVNGRARRMILRVDSVTGEVQVVVPSMKAAAQARDFAQAHAGWIAQQRARTLASIGFQPGDMIPFQGEDHEIWHLPETRRGVWLDPCANRLCVSGDLEHVPRRVEDWLKRQARSVLNERSRTHGRAIGVMPSRVTVRDTKTRWGSCSATGALSFSWRLILTPPFVLDYVAAHEVAHLVHHNHGPQFWALVRSMGPDVGAATVWLKKHGPGLHRFGAGRS